LTNTAGNPRARQKQKPNTDQHKRFIEAAREAECSEDEAVFDETLKRIAKVKEKPAPEKK
jgi:hypothetical protein